MDTNPSSPAEPLRVTLRYYRDLSKGSNDSTIPLQIDIHPLQVPDLLDDLHKWVAGQDVRVVVTLEWKINLPFQ